MWHEEVPGRQCSRVLSRFAMMFFAEREAGASELARVLRPGGRVCVATWAELRANPGYAATCS